MKDKFTKTKFIPVIIFFAISIFAFIFTYKAINHKNEILQQSYSEWQAEILKRDEMRQLDNSIKGVEKERTILNAHFTKSSDVVPFLDTIEKLATSVSAKAEISSVDVAPEGNSLNVVIKATGSFEALYKFLTLMENSSYELEFISMDIHQFSASETGSSQWEASFAVKLLSFIP